MWMREEERKGDAPSVYRCPLVGRDQRREFVEYITYEKMLRFPDNL